MEITINFKEEKEILHVLVKGEIDAYTAPKLRDKLDAIEIEEKANIAIDLSEVTYIDSTGLGVFVAFYKRATRETAHVRLVGLSERIKRLFEITGLSDLMDIDTDKKVELS
ncbi:anti-sigma-B factor antagonist [Lysinibacillus alkalisoli]|uniref:Anti-sigma factor antagonist n=1 Tax=Lysinibacillus alkalisoli TaxID=1911548 RepID=A0A917LHS3_9BACI|nr:STAS domain-containing protein [Lysinibacillus alkalisoli]GGG24906.1 anti-sigma-B factor antagonist [Lysinibacillus alkalisoli]